MLATTGGGLTPSEVFVRIRPAVRDGGGHDQDGEAVAKMLEGWTDTSVTLATQYLFSKGSNVYAFPRHVFGPEVTQEDVFEGTVARAVERFTEWEGSDVMVLAYGQTGTGKTTTIFGFEPALKGYGPRTGWGMFPRVCEATLARMRSASTGTSSFLLTVSAVEFYMMQCLDLLDDKKVVAIDESSHIVGEVRAPIDEVADVIPAIERVMAARTTRSTRMNVAAGDHEGSSRSHCALILTLAAVRGGDVCETRFTLLDLAGAERPSKVSEVKPSAEMQIWEAERSGRSPPEDSLESQTTLVNYELCASHLQPLRPGGTRDLCPRLHRRHLMSRQVLMATENHRAGRAYNPPTQMVTPAIRFISTCLTGSCLTIMIVTLSQAPQNGWETWFSLQYGTDLSKLQVPLKRQRARNYRAELKEARERAAEAKKAIADGPPAEGAPSAKYYPRREAAARQAVHRVHWLERLGQLQ